MGVQQVLNSHSIGSGVKWVAKEQLVMIFSKSRLVFVWFLFTQLSFSHLDLALNALKDSSGNKLKNELFPFVFNASVYSVTRL